MVKVELVYVALNKATFHVQLQLSPGATIADAIKESRVEEQYPETKGLPVGIFSKLKEVHTVLRDGDRVEIYRPLTQDPKVKRRIKASAQSAPTYPLKNTK